METSEIDKILKISFYHLKHFNSSMYNCREEKPIGEIRIEINVQHFNISNR